MDFNAEAELEIIQSQAKAKRKRRYARSKLDRFTIELISLRQAGSTITELQIWLKKNKTKVHWTTIDRWLKRHG